MHLSKKDYKILYLFLTLVKKKNSHFWNNSKNPIKKSDSTFSTQNKVQYVVDNEYTQVQMIFKL